MLRSKKGQSALDRLGSILLKSPVFKPLHKKYIQKFPAFISKKLSVIEGDITQKNLGMENYISNKLKSDLNLVINSAGLTDFNPDIRSASKTNIQGTLNISDFVQGCEKAKMLHISTCFVSGNSKKQGKIFHEELDQNKTPNGKDINSHQEYEYILKTIKRQECLFSNKSNTKKEIKDHFIKFGKKRAEFWGWSNAYVYTKALAEKLLVHKNISFSIIRPSIVESSINYPFPGWNEGCNTSTPIIYLAGQWYPHFLGDGNNTLDIIPVDLLAKSITIVCCKLLKNESDLVYHCSTSAENPLYINSITQYMQISYRAYFKNHSKKLLCKHLRGLLRPKAYKEEWIFSSEKIAKTIAIVQKYLGYLNIRSKKLSVLQKSFETNDYIGQLFKPFVYEPQYRYAAKKIFDVEIHENEFKIDLHDIHWPTYCQKILLPGLQKWCFPILEKKIDKNIYYQQIYKSHFNRN